MPLTTLGPRSDSARIRNMLPQIEEALKHGASRESVWKALQEEHGLTVGYEGFLRALGRARKNAKAVATDQRPAPTTAEIDAPVLRNTESRQVAPEPSEQDNGQRSEVKHDRIMTKETLQRVHDMDFSQLDDERYK